MSRRSPNRTAHALTFALSSIALVTAWILACEPPMAGPQYPAGGPPPSSPSAEPISPTAEDGGVAPAPSISAQPGDIQL